jgi:hypothetical protein
MRRHRLLGLAFCFAATLVAAPAAAQNINVGEFNLLFLNPDPDLRLQSGSLASATGINEVDFVQEFGIEKEWFPEIRFSAGRRHKFRFGYLPVRYEAETIIVRTIIFRGQTFSVGAPASTDINWDIWRFGYEWDFVSTDRGFVGVIGELKYNRLDASVESPALLQAATTEQKAPIPTIGVIGRGFVHPMVSITAEFSGLQFNTDDFEAKFYDFDINGAVTFGRYIGVQGGYRQVTVDYFIDEDSGDLKLKGPYIGLVARF